MMAFDQFLQETNELLGAMIVFLAFFFSYPLRRSLSNLSLLLLPAQRKRRKKEKQGELGAERERQKKRGHNNPNAFFWFGSQKFRMKRMARKKKATKIWLNEIRG